MSEPLESFTGTALYLDTMIPYALHLAAMQKVGCLDLVSQDPDFDRIPLVRRYALV